MQLKQKYNIKLTKLGNIVPSDILISVEIHQKSTKMQLNLLLKKMKPKVFLLILSPMITMKLIKGGF